MARATQAKVEAVIEVDTDLWSDDLLTYAATIVGAAEDQVSSGTYSEDQLTFMEVYVAAHFYAVKEQKAQREKAGRSSVQYQGKYGMGLEATSWGQQALSMDAAGALAKVTGSEGGVKSVGAAWLGTTTEDS